MGSYPRPGWLAGLAGRLDGVLCGSLAVSGDGVLQLAVKIGDPVMLQA